MRKTESIKDPKVLKKYSGQYVARKRNVIVMHGNGGDQLFKRLERKGIDPTKVVIDYIPPQGYFFSLHVG